MTTHLTTKASPNSTTPDHAEPGPTTPDRRPVHRRALRWPLRLLAGLATVVVLGAVFGITYQAVASTVDDRNHPAPGVLIDVGGHRLHLLCQGAGSPTVVLESGLGGFSHDWSHLQPGLAATTRTCSYDRAGYGWSDGVEVPLTSAEIATDLRELLAGAGEDGPFVLVGHSIGGLHARSFAGRYPDETKGIVLIDSSHENQAVRLSMLDPLDDATLGGLRLCDRLSVFGLPRLLGANGGAIPDSLDIPADTRAAWVSRLNRTGFCATIISELDAIEADIARPHPPASLGRIPLIVLSSGAGISIEDGANVDGITDADLGEANHVAAELQRELAALSTDSTHHIVPDAGHYIHWDDPAAVSDAVADIIQE